MKYLLILSAFLLAACDGELTKYRCIDGLVYVKLDTNVWVRATLYGPECKEVK